MTVVTYTFKFAFTQVTINYSFDNVLTMSQFINNITNQVYVDFDIRQDLTIEIVEAGLNTNQYISEMAPSVALSDVSFKNYYINRTPNDLSFYIRVKTPNNNVVQQIENMRNANSN
jgi:hypothetical protein